MKQIRKHSLSVPYSYLTKKQHKKIDVFRKFGVTRSQSLIFFFNNQDFLYLLSNNLKHALKFDCKIPFFPLTKNNSLSLKKSYSCDSIKKYQFILNNSSNKTYHLNKSDISNKIKFMNLSNLSNQNNSNIMKNKSSVFPNYKSYSLLHRNSSCFDLNSLINKKHAIFLHHGCIPCFKRCYSRINYSQHVDMHNSSNITSSTIDLTDFFNRDERINERELNYIAIQKAKKKVSYFTRQKNKLPIKKNQHKNGSKKNSTSPVTTNKNANSPLSQKDRPRFNLYFPKDSTPLTKKVYPRPQPPKPSSASVLNRKYNIRTRAFKENNIRNFYQELAKAEEDDKHFIFDPKNNNKTPKSKRGRSAESQQKKSTFAFDKRKRSKSAQNSPDNDNILNSPTLSHKDKPRFKLYFSKYSSPQNSKKTANDWQSPKPSSASVLNEKYNIRSRLLKEMNVHEFYKKLAEAEEESRLQVSLKQVHLSSRSKRVVERYFQRQKTLNSQSNQNEENQIEKQNDNDNQNENDHSSQNSDIKVEISSSAGNLSDPDKNSLLNTKDDNFKIISNESQNDILNSQKNLENTNSNEAINGKNKEDKNKINIQNKYESEIEVEIEKRGIISKKIEKEKNMFNENDNEQSFKIKKFSHKVPGFVSDVTDFFKEYNIKIREEYPKPKPTSKKKKSNS